MSEIEGVLLKGAMKVYALKDSATHEVLRIDREGRIFWNGREVLTDDDLRAAMRELADTMKRLHS